MTGLDPNQMLTTAEAATLLGLKPATLANWREDGAVDLAFSKFGSASVIATRTWWPSRSARCKSTLAARQVAARQSARGR